MFQVNATGDTLTSTWSSPPGTTWTHVVILISPGMPHYLGYNSFTGDAGLFRIGSNTTDPALVAPSSCNWEWATPPWSRSR